MPQYRTSDYAIWRACERTGIRPPDTKESWNDCDIWTRAMIIAYSQIREYEDNEENINMYKALGASL